MLASKCNHTTPEYKYRTDYYPSPQATSLLSASASLSSYLYCAISTMIISALLVQCLLAASALALPSSRERMERRMAARGHNVAARKDESGGVRQTAPIHKLTNVTVPLVSDTNPISYTSNWAGAFFNEAPVGSVAL